MYFEPTKRTYYRFPSASSINDLDRKNYFPDKKHGMGEDLRLEARASNHAEHDSDHQIK